MCSDFMGFLLLWPEKQNGLPGKGDRVAKRALCSRRPLRTYYKNSDLLRHAAITVATFCGFWNTGVQNPQKVGRLSPSVHAGDEDGGGGGVEHAAQDAGGD